MFVIINILVKHDGPYSLLFENTLLTTKFCIDNNHSMNANSVKLVRTGYTL